MPKATRIELHIGGSDRPASSAAVFERRNPLSGEVVTIAAAASPDDGFAAAEAAAAAQPAWAAMGPNARRMILLKAADELEARADAIVAAMCAETGGAQAWARFNVMLGAGVFREAGSMTTQIGGEVIPSDKPGCVAMAVRQPAGVVLGVAPWNAPVILGVRAIAMPLACGNAVILKASEQSPATQAFIIEALKAAGLPDGVANFVTTAPQLAGAVVEAIMDHKAVRRVNFTGSTRVGRIIAEAGAKRLTPVLLELGGKAPLVVLDDADLDAAVEATAFGAFMNQGQICMSTERVIVDASVADEFVRRLSKKAAGLTVGDPRKGAVAIGAMIDEGPADRALSLVLDAQSQGALIVFGGRREGAIMTPTVVDHVTDAMRLYSEETFGPVVAVIRAEGVDEAVRLANDSEYGLSAAVFGRDVARALSVAQRLDTGICHVNGPTVHDEAQMPFGGVKSSGYGRFGGKAGIEAFTDLRWITIETAPQRYPF